MNTTTDTTPLCSSSEARALLRAIRVLDAIGDRATRAAYSQDAATARSLGHVAGACSLADRAVFGAFSAIGIYGGSPQATAAMDKHLGRDDD